MTALTRQEFAESLNELEIPFHDLKSNGGRIPDDARYGDWLRRNDPVAFNVAFQEARREADWRESPRRHHWNP